MNTTTPQAAKAPSPSLVRAKDRASMAVILSGMSAAWFGWGQQGQVLIGALYAAMVVSAIVLIAAILTVRSIPAPPSVATDPSARKMFWIALVVEVIAIVAGLAILGATGNGAYGSTWTILVVGLHFIPLARPFNTPALTWLAVVCSLVAAAALVCGLAGLAPAPTIAGAGGGLILLGFAISLILSARALLREHRG